jgi:hypothetical protein
MREESPSTQHQRITGHCLALEVSIPNPMTASVHHRAAHQATAASPLARRRHALCLAAAQPFLWLPWRPLPRGALACQAQCTTCRCGAYLRQQLSTTVQGRWTNGGEEVTAAGGSHGHGHGRGTNCVRSLPQLIFLPSSATGYR